MLYDIVTVQLKFVNKFYFLLHFNLYYYKLFDYNSNILRTQEIDIVLEYPFNLK